MGENPSSAIPAVEVVTMLGIQSSGPPMGERKYMSPDTGWGDCPLMAAPVAASNWD